MVVVITSHGSTGDIFPLIGLSVALQEAGHEVRFATSKPFQNEVQDAGLPFYPLPPDWTREDLAFWMGKMQTVNSPIGQLKMLYEATLPYFEDAVDEMDRVLEGADCLISSYLFPMNRALADRHNMPFIAYAFAHNAVPSIHYPPYGLPSLSGLPNSVRQLWNRLTWKLGNIVADSAINRTISQKLKNKGLPRVRNFFSKPAELVLVAVSPALMRPKTELDPRFQFTGYCRWQAPTSDEAEKRIREFRGDKLVPILSFGSMVYQDPSRHIERLLRCWPSDKKLIIQTGWSGFKIPASTTHILEIGSLSHDQLFRHASVVIHHGGSGTTASALHSGKPHIVIPHIGDQAFFSAEIVRLGCGVRCKKKVWPEQLHRIVTEIESNTNYNTNAQKWLAVLETEDGPGEAIHQIQNYVESDRAAKGRSLHSVSS